MRLTYIYDRYLYAGKRHLYIETVPDPWNIIRIQGNFIFVYVHLLFVPNFDAWENDYTTEIRIRAESKWSSYLIRFGSHRLFRRISNNSVPIQWFCTDHITDDICWPFITSVCWMFLTYPLADIRQTTTQFMAYIKPLHSCNISWCKSLPYLSIPWLQRRFSSVIVGVRAWMNC